MANNDTEVILTALKKEREIAHQRVMQLDRIIKHVKEGKYSGNNIESSDRQAEIRQPVVFNQSFKTADIKIQILKVFDSIGKAVKLQVLQDEYNRLAESKYPIRDNIRSLQNSRKIVMIKEKGANRGFLWAKSEWIENGQLLDEYKPDGFDLLYKSEDLILE